MSPRLEVSFQLAFAVESLGGRVCEITEELMEGDDDQLLARVCSERLTVFPVNVTRDEQRQSLQTWFSKLPAVQNPGALSGCDGPGFGDFC